MIFEHLQYGPPLSLPSARLVISSLAVVLLIASFAGAPPPPPSHRVLCRRRRPPPPSIRGALDIFQERFRPLERPPCPSKSLQDARCVTAWDPRAPRRAAGAQRRADTRRPRAQASFRRSSTRSAIRCRSARHASSNLRCAGPAGAAGRGAGASAARRRRPRSARLTRQGVPPHAAGGHPHARVLSGHARVPHPVLIGHAASLRWTPACTSTFPTRAQTRGAPARAAPGSSPRSAWARDLRQPLGVRRRRARRQAVRGPRGLRSGRRCMRGV